MEDEVIPHSATSPFLATVALSQFLRGPFSRGQTLPAGACSRAGALFYPANTAATTERRLFEKNINLLTPK